MPGKIVYREEALAPAIKDQITHATYDARYQAFNEKFNCLEGPDTGTKILEKLIDLDAVPSFTALQRVKARKLRINIGAMFFGFFRTIGLFRSPNTKKLAAWRNKHKGERCFLIGNGPSLTVDDLDKIAGETSFSCNLIYKIFDTTQWRPTYHCITDGVFTSTVSREIVREITMPFFTNDKAYNQMKKKPKNTTFVWRYLRDPYFVHPNMLAYYVPASATVMTFMIELAMYMGFSEIYLVGVDCSNGFVGNSHFIRDYENPEMLRIEETRRRNLVHGKQLSLEELGEYRQQRSMFAYSQLRKHAEKHGIKIYNATRGGLLEEFERVCLDDIV